jgi:hypothetical protein
MPFVLEKKSKISIIVLPKTVTKMTDKINYLLNVKKYCDVVWGAYCCVTKFFARECSQSDQEAYEFAIKDEVDKIELNFCPKYPRESFNCKEVNFGK